MGPQARSEGSGCCAGMIDGQLFRKVMANSPGGILADSSQGQPPIFISAGLQDNIFPIQQAGNAVRPASSCRHQTWEGDLSLSICIVAVSL